MQKDNRTITEDIREISLDVCVCVSVWFGRGKEGGGGSEGQRVMSTQRVINYLPL